MLLYPSNSRRSMLLPNGCDIDWTDLTRVLSDNVPEAAGLGATQIAQQALGIQPSAAAALVAAAGASNASTFRPGTAFGGGASAPTAVSARGVNTCRLPIPPNVNTTAVFLCGDQNRAFMLLQNNNTATNGTNLLINIDGPVDITNPGFYLNLAPGVGLLLDEAIFVNPIYLAWAATPDLGGTCWFGSKASVGPAKNRNSFAVMMAEEWGENAQQISAQGL